MAELLPLMKGNSKVSIIRCGGYEQDILLDAVRRAVGLIGGIGNFVKPGQKVLIKPNILSARLPEEAVCTHPEFVRAVARLVKTQTSQILIGDSPGGFHLQRTDRVYEISGVKKVADEEGVGLASFSISVNIDGLPIAKITRDVDVIISLPKMKTHTQTILTGAVKNMFGAVVGMHKAECHFRGYTTEEFCKLLVGVFSAARPLLNIMDGIYAMDKDGPAAGRVRYAGLILASSDAVALDAVFAELVGLQPQKCPTTKIASLQGVGIADLERIEILGERLEDVRLKDFILPRTSYIYRAPKFITEFFGNSIRAHPVIDEFACKKCKICEENCPTKAVSIGDERCRIDYSKCIFCFCCHELCPHNAVKTQRSVLGALLAQAVKIRDKIKKIGVQ